MLKIKIVLKQYIILMEVNDNCLFVLVLHNTETWAFHFTVWSRECLCQCYPLPKNALLVYIFTMQKQIVSNLQTSQSLNMQCRNFNVTLWMNGTLFELNQRSYQSTSLSQNITLNDWRDVTTRNNTISWIHKLPHVQ